MTTTKPIFDEPEPQTVTLSKHYQTLRLPGLGMVASWTKRNYQKFRSCDECFWLQHETKGEFRPRRKVAWKRTTGQGSIEICSEHARLWKELDDEH